MATLAGEVAEAEIHFDDWSAAAADEGVAWLTEACLDGFEPEVLFSPCAVCHFHAVITEPHAGDLRIF